MQNDSARVADGVYRMAHAVDKPGSVARFPAHDLFEKRRDFFVVRVVPNTRLAAVEHLHHLDIRPAVTVPLEGADSGRNSGIGIGPGGGHHARGKGGIVAAAVFCMKHQTQVEQVRFLFGILIVNAQSVENRLRGVVGRVERMKIHRLLVIMAALYLVGVDHNGRQRGDQADGLADQIFYGAVFRIRIIGIQRQHRTCNFIHNVGGRGFDDHVLHKIFRQFAAGGDQAGEGC